jgi:cysteinyl-tRNA synthetase
MQRLRRAVHPGPNDRALRDLEREATRSWTPSEEVLAVVAARDAARDAKDYEASDRLRDELAELGLEVMDTAEGTKVRPRD